MDEKDDNKVENKEEDDLYIHMQELLNKNLWELYGS